jgi:hypothetical protein
MKAFFLLGANPIIPVAIGILIYLWATAGWSYIGRPFMGAMWFFYGMANLALILDTLQLQGKLPEWLQKLVV